MGKKFRTFNAAPYKTSGTMGSGKVRRMPSGGQAKAVGPNNGNIPMMGSNFWSTVFGIRPGQGKFVKAQKNRNR